MQDNMFCWYCFMGLVLQVGVMGLLKNKAILLDKENTPEKTLTLIKVGLYLAIPIGLYLMIIGQFSTLSILLGMAAICLSLGGIGLCDLALKELESNFVTKVAIICFMGTGLISLGGTFLPYPSAQWWGQRVDWLEGFMNFIGKSPLTFAIFYFTFLTIVLLTLFYGQRSYFTSNKQPRCTEIYAPLWLAQLFGSPINKLQLSGFFAQIYYLMLLILSLFIMLGLIQPLKNGNNLLIAANIILSISLYLFTRIRTR